MLHGWRRSVTSTTLRHLKIVYVAALWRYPVKSMAGEPLCRIEVSASGFTGDRIVQVYRPNGRVATARTSPGLLGHRATLGLLLSTAATRLLRRLLFGLSPLDPLTFAGALVIFVVATLAACWIPAWRAVRLNPVEALRDG